MAKLRHDISRDLQTEAAKRDLMFKVHTRTAPPFRKPRTTLGGLVVGTSVGVCDAVSDVAGCQGLEARRRVDAAVPVVGFDCLAAEMQIEQQRASRFHKLEPFSAEWWSNISAGGPRSV